MKSLQQIKKAVLELIEHDPDIQLRILELNRKTPENKLTPTTRNRDLEEKNRFIQQLERQKRQEAWRKEFDAETKEVL